MLVCLPGFSTAAEITDVSGRGVGMDAVRATVQAIGGTLAIESYPGKGSCFTLSLPLTISIIQILLVACSSMVVGLPVTKVLRTVDIRKDSVLSRGKRKVFQLGDEEIPLVSLHRLLDLPFSPIKGESIPAVIVEISEQYRGTRCGPVCGPAGCFRQAFRKPSEPDERFIRRGYSRRRSGNFYY